MSVRYGIWRACARQRAHLGWEGASAQPTPVGVGPTCLRQVLRGDKLEGDGGEQDSKRDGHLVADELNLDREGERGQPRDGEAMTSLQVRPPQ